MNEYRHHFTDDDRESFRPTEKIGIVATINDDGKPHITLITTMEPNNERELILGQFSHGLSKMYMQHNNNVALLIMTLDRRLWLGQARWTHAATDGPEYEHFNNKPMFRYNTYFGINTVHFLDLVSITGPSPLPMPQIVKSALWVMLAKMFRRSGKQEKPPNSIALGLFNNLGALKFLSWVDNNGMPRLVPIIQCQAADPARIVFSPGPWGNDLKVIPSGTEVAVFAMTLDMEDVLVRGRYRAFSGLSGLAEVDIDWVYNSLPPAHGQIYPEVKLEAVRQF